MDLNIVSAKIRHGPNDHLQSVVKIDRSCAKICMKRLNYNVDTLNTMPAALKDVCMLYCHIPSQRPALRADHSLL